MCRYVRIFIHSVPVTNTHQMHKSFVQDVKCTISNVLATKIHLQIGQAGGKYLLLAISHVDMLTTLHYVRFVLTGHKL